MGRLLWRCDTAAEAAETTTVGGACKLEACGAEAKASPSMAGDILCFKSPNEVHIQARVSYGFCLVTKSLGNSVGINMGYYCAVLTLTNSIAITEDGAKGAAFLYSTGHHNPESSQVAGKRRSGTNAEVLESR